MRRGGWGSCEQSEEFGQAGARNGPHGGAQWAHVRSPAPHAGYGCMGTSPPRHAQRRERLGWPVVLLRAAQPLHCCQTCARVPGSPPCYFAAGSPAGCCPGGPPGALPACGEAEKKGMLQGCLLQGCKLSVSQGGHGMTAWRLSRRPHWQRRSSWAAASGGQCLRTSARVFCCRGSAKACNEAAPACTEEREA